MSRYSLYKAKGIRYPESFPLYRPSSRYPEYPFPSSTCESIRNDIYDGLRETFRMAGLDASSYGTGDWNPLGEFIDPGMRVLVKPNLVMHINPTGYGTDCLYTHPSVIAAVVDYIVIALKGEGIITLADAPMQSCDFEALVAQSGLQQLIDWYKSQGINIELKDMRGLKSSVSKAGLKQSIVKDAAGKVIDLGVSSSFFGLPSERIDSLRITNYDPSELKKHHTATKHEYYISDELLEADVVVNLPKAKTHRKAGITGALKNMVGVNVRKEYLPHHANGSKAEGFDEYEKPSALKRASDALLDAKNRLLDRGSPLEKKVLSAAIRGLGYFGKRTSGDFNREGSWHGNDTIWRTVLDLNKIVFYADKQGVMHDDQQRRMIVICDMVTIGQGEGPLLPEPGEWGMLAFCDDPVTHDVAMARLLGTDESKIPTVHEALQYDGPFAFWHAGDGLPDCISNDSEFGGIGVGRLNADLRYRAKPTSGWAPCFLREE